MKNKKEKRDPKKALDSQMKLVSTKIQKILVDNDLALHPFIHINPYNGAQTPQVRLISTKVEDNVIETGNQEATGSDKDEDGTTGAE